MGILAKSKLDSVTDSISKALVDDSVSKEEYLLSSEELETFKFTKERIRKTTMVEESNGIPFCGKLIRFLSKLFARR